jgi:hypothetical protein
MNEESKNIEDLLDRIETSAANRDHISFKGILEKVGRRSFGALLLVAGLITRAPVVGDIPGVPTIMGLYVLVTSIQLLLRRNHFWLPNWLLKRSIAKEKLCKAIAWMRPPARWADRLLRQRMHYLVQGAGFHATAIMCTAIALLMPVLEFVPFSANGAGAALTAFGLSLTAGDGLLALLAYIFTIVTFGTVFFIVFV